MVSKANSCAKNEDLLKDELYLGNHHPRTRGKDYDAFIDKFIESAREHFPKAYIHCVSLQSKFHDPERFNERVQEDFGPPNARRILDKYKDKIAIFNDDVEGTGCVTLAALMAAMHVSKINMKDVRIVCYGAGTAGTGIADQISKTIAVESEKSQEEARKQIWYDFNALLAMVLKC